MKKLSLIAAGLLLSAGLIAFAADSNDGKKAKEPVKSSCQQSVPKESCDKSLCDTTNCAVKCCPPACKKACKK
jgi:hypothetical protein